MGMNMILIKIRYVYAKDVHFLVNAHLLKMLQIVSSTSSLVTVRSITSV